MDFKKEKVKMSVIKELKALLLSQGTYTVANAKVVALKVGILKPALHARAKAK